MKLIALLPLLLLAQPGQAPDERPSFLFAVADDWSYGHAGAYGDKTVQTPTFDRVAAEGVLFTHSFCASPSCTPSRAAALTGQAIHRLEDSGNLWSRLAPKFDTYPDLLEKQGYAVGLQGKGWGPGDYKAGGRDRNPAGPLFKSFEEFIKTVPPGKPFCYWYGSRDPHRPYVEGSGAKSGLALDSVQVPPYLPDTPEVRGDLLDYYFAVQRYDRDTGEILRILEERNRTRNTVVVMTSDNGLPFPRAKATLYDSGTRMPLAIRWPAKIQGGRKVDALVSHCDFAPTVLEIAGQNVPASMTGRSLLPLLKTGEDAGRDRVFFGRERHANVRQGDLSYPARAIRTKEYLYIRNLRPDLWPAGDPEKWVAVGTFGDVDEGPSKLQIIARRDQDLRTFFRMAFEKRPPAELFDVVKDPNQLENIVSKQPEVVAKLDAELTKWLAETGDPRVVDGKLGGGDPRWDKYPYFGK
jgi:N-sulfoglucosamine sulfohydrolase